MKTMMMRLSTGSLSLPSRPGNRLKRISDFSLTVLAFLRVKKERLSAKLTKLTKELARSSSNARETSTLSDRSSRCNKTGEWKSRWKPNNTVNANRTNNSVSTAANKNLKRKLVKGLTQPSTSSNRTKSATSSKSNTMRPRPKALTWWSDRHSRSPSPRGNMKWSKGKTEPVSSLRINWETRQTSSTSTKMKWPTWREKSWSWSWDSKTLNYWKMRRSLSWTRRTRTLTPIHLPFRDRISLPRGVPKWALRHPADDLICKLNYSVAVSIPNILPNSYIS